MSVANEREKSSEVDESLVAMFLRMTPEERILANDNMIRTILELRDAYEQAKTEGTGSGRDS